MGDAVELGYGGPDGGRQVLLALFVPLGPDAAKAVVGHHLLKELLQTEGKEEERKEERKIQGWRERRRERKGLFRGTDDRQVVQETLKQE